MRSGEDRSARCPNTAREEAKRRTFRETFDCMFAKSMIANAVAPSNAGWGDSGHSEKECIRARNILYEWHLSSSPPSRAG